MSGASPVHNEGSDWEVSGRCPEESVLREYLHGLIDDERASQIDQHFAGCASCLATAEQIERGTLQVQSAADTDVAFPDEQTAIESLKNRLRDLNFYSGDGQRESETPPSGLYNTAGTQQRSDAEVLALLAPPENPDELGRLAYYRILSQIGAGGMGIVFHAEDTRLQRSVALKVMRCVLAGRETDRERFLREARAVAAIRNDHVIDVYDVGEENGVPFMAMPLLDGESLAQRLRRAGSLPIERAVRLGLETAIALDAAHSAGTVHRDIKPDNIWIQESGRIVVLDFGLARHLSTGDTLTLDGTVVGTPRYISPEQVLGERVDHRCDLFSLGGVLYHALSGRGPFDRRTVTAMVLAVVEDTPQPIREVNPNVPEELARLIDQLIEKDPAIRPQTAAEVAKKLTQIDRRIVGNSEAPIGREDTTGRSTLSDVLSSFWFRATAVLTAICLIPLLMDLREPSPPDPVVPEPKPTAVADLPPPSDVDQVQMTNYGPIYPNRPKLSTTTQQLIDRRKSLAEELGVPIERDIDLGDGHSIRMVLIPPGDYLHGSGEEEKRRMVKQARAERLEWLISHIDAEKGLWQVRFTEPFWISAHEVTVGTFRRFAAATAYQTDAERDGAGGFGYKEGVWGQDPKFVWKVAPGFLQDDSHPVVNVTWHDAMTFCDWLSDVSGEKNFSLPTEQQWEYVCRAGTTSVWYFGNEADETNLRKHAWYGWLGTRGTQPVGRLEPNPLGVYDLYGNASEWTIRLFDTADPDGRVLKDVPPEMRSVTRERLHAVYRGGAYSNSSTLVRSASRINAGQHDRFDSCGFRVVCPVTQQ